MNISQIRRHALGLWLQGVRLPLTAAERIARPADTDPENWPPTVAFTRAEAAVKGFVGRVTGDQTLIGLSNLQRAEATQREQALAKRSIADATRVEARETAEAKEETLARQREQAEERAEKRERQLEQDKRDAEHRVAQEKAEKEAAVDKQAAARQDAIDAQATKVEADRLRKEAQALQAKRQAVEAEGAVLDLDKAVRAKKAARKAG